MEPLQRSRNCLRHSPVTPMARSVEGTIYRSAGCPVLLMNNATKAMASPNPYPKILMNECNSIYLVKNNFQSKKNLIYSLPIIVVMK